MNLVAVPNFFQHQLDYVFFFYGLSFCLLAAVAFNLHQKKRGPLAWDWLCLFALAHGLNEFVDLLNLSVGNGPVSAAVFLSLRLILMIGSFLFLMAFARASLMAVRGRGPGWWVFILCLALVSVGGMTGLAGLDAAARYTLCLVGSSGAAWALFLAWKAQPQQNGALLKASIGFAIYAFAAGLVVPQAPFFPANVLNYASFQQTLGFPVQLLRGLTAVWIAAAIWEYAEQFRSANIEELHRLAQIRYRRRFYLALLIVLLSGWAVTEFVGRNSNAATRKNLLDQVSQAASLLDAEQVRSLTGTAADLGNPDYQTLKQQLNSIHQGIENCYYAHLLGLKNNRLVYLVDSNLKGPLNRTALGQSHEREDLNWATAFATPQPFLKEPYSDSFGQWISGFAPVREKDTGKVIAMLGIDLPAQMWSSREAGARLVSILVVFLLAVQLILTFVARQRIWISGLHKADERNEKALKLVDAGQKPHA